MVSKSYSDVIKDAVDDLAEHGYDSVDRVAYWTQRIREAAEQTVRSKSEMDRVLREAMEAVFKSLVERGKVLHYHTDIARFTLERIRPQLRGELDRRILAAADLIRLNKEESVRKTLQRFQGWSTSIPKGGSDTVDKRKVKKDLKKPVAQEKFEERRVLVDQGHKLRASISEVLAVDGGAIAGIWHSHWRQANYDYRPDHKDRDEKVYLMAGNWALTAGLVKAGPAGLYNKITAAGVEPYCRCFVQWLYSLRAIERYAPEMLTKRGREELSRVRIAA